MARANNSIDTTSSPILKENKKPVAARQIQASRNRITGSLTFQNFILLALVIRLDDFNQQF
jgi:hypothetical protein